MTESVAEHKSRLRMEFRARRRAMTDIDRQRRSTRMWRRVVDTLTDAGQIGPGHRTMAFFGFGDEPPTETLHRAVWDAGGSLLLPRVEGSTIVPVPHLPDGPIRTGSLGIPEPTGRPIDPATIEAMIVPALAFDRQGHRLGYGAGFYDRFLSVLAPECMVLGVCLAPMLVDRLPTDEHDVNVPMVVTDEAVHPTPAEPEQG